MRLPSMIHHASNCNDDQLRRVLASNSDDPDIAMHLEACSRCQSRLSELAAEANQWQETRELLSTSDEFAAEARQRPWSGLIHGEKSDEARPAWTEAMARQLL